MSTPSSDTHTRGGLGIDTLISTEELAERLDDAHTIVIDCTIFLHLEDGGYRSESGLANFEAGHIPGAQFADLNQALVDADSSLRYAVPTPEHFASAMAALGVSDATDVVLYDDNQSMWAARVWWMLRWVGFDNAALLDGGLKAWKAEGRTVIAGPAEAAKETGETITIAERPSLIAARDEVLEIIAAGGSCLIDALPGAVFRGDVQPYARPGHIPGAINVPATSMVDRDTGRFLPDSEIRSMLPDRPEARTVIY